VPGLSGARRPWLRGGDPRRGWIWQVPSRSGVRSPSGNVGMRALVTPPGAQWMVRRAHARVEDHIGTGRDTGLGRLPSRSFAINAAWLTATMIAVDLLALAQTLLPHDTCLARAEAQGTALSTAARRSQTHPRTAPALASTRPALAVGNSTICRLRPPRRAAHAHRLTFEPVTTSGGSDRQNSGPDTSPRPPTDTIPTKINRRIPRSASCSVNH